MTNKVTVLSRGWKKIYCCGSMRRRLRALSIGVITHCWESTVVVLKLWGRFCGVIAWFLIEIILVIAHHLNYRTKSRTQYLLLLHQLPKIVYNPAPVIEASMHGKYIIPSLHDLYNCPYIDVTPVVYILQLCDVLMCGKLFNQFMSFMVSRAIWQKSFSILSFFSLRGFFFIHHSKLSNLWFPCYSTQQCCSPHHYQTKPRELPSLESPVCPLSQRPTFVWLCWWFGHISTTNDLYHFDWS